MLNGDNMVTYVFQVGSPASLGTVLVSGAVAVEMI